MVILGVKYAKKTIGAVVRAFGDDIEPKHQDKQENLKKRRKNTHEYVNYVLKNMQRLVNSTGK